MAVAQKIRGFSIDKAEDLEEHLDDFDVEDRVRQEFDTTIENVEVKEEELIETILEREETAFKVYYNKKFDMFNIEELNIIKR